MSSLILPRRRFLTGLATLFAAPAIVRAASLMPVKAGPKYVTYDLLDGYEYIFRTSSPEGKWRAYKVVAAMGDNSLFEELRFTII